MTMRGYFGLLRYSPTLRFTVFGAIAYTVSASSACCCRFVRLQVMCIFTEASVAYSHLGLYAFFSMVMFVRCTTSFRDWSDENGVTPR